MVLNLAEKKILKTALLLGEEEELELEEELDVEQQEEVKSDMSLFDPSGLYALYNFSEDESNNLRSLLS